MIKCLRPLTVGLAALALVATASGAGAADPFEIDVLLPMTGSASFYAVAEQQSLHIIEQTVNKTGGIGGRPLKFVLNDDQSDANVDVQLAGGILAKHPAVLLGPALTAQCNAIMPLVASGPATWCFTPGPRPVSGGYVIAFGADTSHTTAVSLRYLKARGITRIGMISSTDASGQDGEKNVDAAATANAVQILDQEHFNPTDLSVTAQLARIKSANPQAIVVWTTGTPFGTVLRAIQELGIDVVSDPRDRRAWVRDRTGGRGADVVFQTADSAAIPEGLTLLRDGGRYVSIGLGGTASISADLFPGQMTFMNVRSGEPRHWLQAIDFLASRKDRVPFDALISETYTLEQVNEAITALAAYEIVKPVITFG